MGFWRKQLVINFLKKNRIGQSQPETKIKRKKPFNKWEILSFTANKPACTFVSSSKSIYPD